MYGTTCLVDKMKIFDQRETAFKSNIVFNEMIISYVCPDERIRGCYTYRN